MSPYHERKKEKKHPTNLSRIRGSSVLHSGIRVDFKPLGLNGSPRLIDYFKTLFIIP
jgi:hypothetical protein